MGVRCLADHPEPYLKLIPSMIRGFQNADMYINAYSSDEGTMKALADGLLGGFPFTGKSPVVLKPHR